MATKRSSNGSFAAALVFFVIATAITILMLLTALVMWLSMLTGSLIVSSLIVAVFFGIIAWIIYMLAIRDGIEHIRMQMETVYDVARIAKSGYDWVTNKLALFIQPRESRESDE